MLTKTITYTDYDGNERKEKFYFNISKAEFADLDINTPGGFETLLQTLIDKKDIPGMMKVFKELIMKSYGVKTPDGKRMIKSQELTDEFMQTEAYSELYFELLQDAKAAAAFVRGVMPIDKSKEAEIDAKLAETVEGL